MLGISARPKAIELWLLYKCSQAASRAEYNTFALATFPLARTESPLATLLTTTERVFPCNGIRNQSRSPKPMLSPLQTFPVSLAVLTWLLLVLLIQFELPAFSHAWLFQDFGHGASSQQLIQLGAGWPELLSVGDTVADGFLREAGLFIITQPCQGALALLCETRLLLPLSGTHRQKLQHPPPSMVAPSQCTSHPLLYSHCLFIALTLLPSFPASHLLLGCCQIPVHPSGRHHHLQT